MIKETKIERILKLILFLDGNYPKSKSDCLDFLEITDSTFYEYMNVLRYSGFEVKQEKGKYWIDIQESENELLARLFHFTEEEAYLLSKAIKQLDVSLPVAARLYRKMLKLFDNDELLSSVVRKYQSEIINSLNQAIVNKKQIMLLNYASGNSQTIKNRLVEPFEFKHEFNLIWAYDVQEQACRQFKISRIEDTELTLLDWKHEKEHRCLPIDVFRNTGTLNLHVQLEMTIRAYNLLIEEYPLAEKQCTTLANGHYLFDTMLAKFEGAARFVLGLADDVEVKESPEFLHFLKERVKTIQNIFLARGNSESS